MLRFFAMLFLLPTLCLGQVVRSEEPDNYNFKDHIDSVVQLKNGCTLTYASDSLFRSMHYTFSTGKSEELDMRDRDNYRGYTALGTDLDNYSFFEKRGDGAANPTYLLLVNKLSGDTEIPGKYPLYIDKVNEVAAYISSEDFSDIIIRNFKTNKIETYKLPDSPCVGGCYKMIKFGKKQFTISYRSGDEEGDETSEVIINRR